MSRLRAQELATHETFALSVADGVFDICPAGGDDQFPWGLYESFASSPEVILELARSWPQAFRPIETRVRSKRARVVLTAILRACRAHVRPFDAVPPRQKRVLLTESRARYDLSHKPVAHPEQPRVPVLRDAIKRKRRRQETCGAAPPSVSKVKHGGGGANIFHTRRISPYSPDARRRRRRTAGRRRRCRTETHEH